MKCAIVCEGLPHADRETSVATNTGAVCLTTSAMIVPCLSRFEQLINSCSPAQRERWFFNIVFHDNGKTIDLHAAVIMPDHVHLLFTGLRDADGWTFALPEILRAIKGSSARSINKLAGRSGQVWQDESFEHVLRGNESLRETVEYIRQNPVRRGLVDQPEAYEWLWVKIGEL